MKLVYTPDAKAEQDGAATYYRLNSPKAAFEFRRELKSLIQRILASPEQFPVIEDGTRRALMHKFPYHIFFEQHDEGILIVGVIHTSREPFIWRNR